MPGSLKSVRMWAAAENGSCPPFQHLKETKDGVGSVDGLVFRDVIRPDVISKRGLLPEVPDPALDDLLG